MDELTPSIRPHALRCVRCKAPLSPAPGLTVCATCGATVRADRVAIDVLPPAAGGGSLGARAMRSAWLARIYERWWRPVTFQLSTAFGAPVAAAEARAVIEHVAGAPGPWLDLSCGTGAMTRALQAHAGDRTVVGVDISMAMLARARDAAPSAVLVRADAAALPFADEAFGAMVNLAALDLYPDRARVLAESARVLMRGGRWVCSTFVARRSTPHVAGWSGVRTPTLDELAREAERAGLHAFGARPFRGYAIAWADKG